MISEPFPYKYRLSIIKEYHVQITEERRKRIIDLYFNQHKSYAEIAEIERISPRDIHAIIKKKPDDRSINMRNNNKKYLVKPTNYFLKVNAL